MIPDDVFYASRGTHVEPGYLYYQIWEDYWILKYIEGWQLEAISVAKYSRVMSQDHHCNRDESPLEVSHLLHLLLF